MGNLRGMIERDLGVTLEADFGIPCVITDPPGAVHTAIQVRFTRDHAEVQPNGEIVIVHVPMIVARTTTLLSVLSRIPAFGERWRFQVPTDMSNQAVLTDFFLDESSPPVDGQSIGYKKFYLKSAVQS